MASADVIGFTLLLVFILVCYAESVNLERQADEPGDTEVVDLEDVIDIALLVPAKHFAIDVYRQSGNNYRQQTHMYHFENQKEDDMLVDPSDVINEVLKTFRRAKITSVVIQENTKINLSFRRLWHDHRGVNEGKKVGSAIIIGGHFGQEFIDAISAYHTDKDKDKDKDKDQDQDQDQEAIRVETNY